VSRIEHVVSERGISCDRAEVCYVRNYMYAVLARVH